MSPYPMKPSQELRIRMNEAMRIYKSSPAVQLTYSDAVRVCEDLMEMLDIIENMHDKRIGFKHSDTT